MDKNYSLWFMKSRQIEIKESSIRSDIGPDEVIVETILSAISPGTELKIYRGEFCTSDSDEKNNSAFSDSFQFPLQYGYSLVGKIISKGNQVSDLEIGQLVFAFHAHEEKFVIKADELRSIPKDVSPEDAVFLPNVETAINFVHDGKPMLGEKIAVFGQGIVGLLTTYLMAQVPFSEVYTFDFFEKRRQISVQLGAKESLDPTKVNVVGVIPNGADLSVEVSGSSHALAQAIQTTGYNGRVVVGSWYGCHPIQFGNAFHRSHINIIASQVSLIRPEFTGRWTKERRFEVVWNVIRKLQPSKLITQRIPFKEAQSAFELLDKRPEETIQVVLTYLK